jgi:hypothetical protein
VRAFALKKAATGAFFGALILIGVDVFTLDTCKPEDFGYYPHDQVEDTLAVQACYEQQGHTVLSPGRPGYLIGGNGVKLLGNKNTKVSSGDSAVRGKLVAMPDMEKPIMIAEGEDYTIENIEWNGQNYVRDIRWIGKTEDTRPPNLIVRGLRPTIRNNVCRESPGGTCIGLDATEARVYLNEFWDNGRQIGEFPYIPGWPFYYLSDALTIPYCYKCLIWKNKFFETTDFAIMAGVIPETWIMENEIYQSRVFAIGAINSGNLLTRRRHPVTGKEADGKNDTAYFYRNKIDCGKGRCGSGISAGSDTFAVGSVEEVPVEHAGWFIENEITGAQINILWEGAKKAEFVNNIPKNPFGNSTFFNPCAVSANLVVGHTQMPLPPNAMRMIIHTTGCQAW